MSRRQRPIDPRLQLALLLLEQAFALAVRKEARMIRAFTHALKARATVIRAEKRTAKIRAAVEASEPM